MQAELAARGFDEQRLSDGGLVVRTTIRKAAQDAAVSAVQGVTGAAPGEDGLQGALVSVDPSTGAVVAYYGGATGTGFDFANNTGTGRQPGSTFKPFVLATALSQGMSLRTRLDGDDEKEFPGIPRPIENFGGTSWGRVDLVEATRRSVNTAYYQLGLEVGPAEVAATARAAGIPDDTPLGNADGSVEGGIALGTYEVQVMDQAAAYATFANGGVPVRPFFVREVRRGDELLFQAEAEKGPAAFSEDVAADATWAMQEVVQRGTGRAAQLDGDREAAGKTGTSSDNKDAWFVGFTPQLSTAVWLGYADPRTITVDGVEVTGGGLSSRIWKGYTDAALAGQPELDLPEPVYAGTRARFDDDVDEEPATRPRRQRAPRTTAPDTTAPETTAPAEPTLEPAPVPSVEEPVEVPEQEPTEPAEGEPSSAALVPSPGEDR